MGYSRWVYTVDQAINYLMNEGCPEEILTQLEAWAHTPVVSGKELKRWIDNCTARPSAEKGE